MKKNPITVYWAPNTTLWNMLYPDPTLVMEDLYKRKNKNSGKKHFFACPAFGDKIKKTYCFKFPLNAGYEWDFSDPINKYFKPTSDSFVNFTILREPTIDNCPQIEFSLYYLFFCEESLVATFTPPFFSPPNYTKYAATAPGSFDIGQWFRPYPVEMTFWEEKGKIKFESGEPLFYVEFLTDRPVILKRFTPTDKITQYAAAGANSSDYLGKNVPLLSRYKTFKETQMNRLIFKEIKDNIL